MKDWSRRSFVSLAAGAPAFAFLTPSSIGARTGPATRKWPPGLETCS